ncbi:MAG: N-acetylmuramoyl-L-alanine amidase [Bacteroidales bacterium]|nr:N-acetylmuramoyl-L-alanine amidase [Bacteroidales bacterium]
MPYKFKVFKILLCGLLFLTPLVSLQAQDVDDVSRIRRVVIDAGHGGKDPGAISRNGKYKEKNITLSVALELGELIKSNFPDIKVIYTRSTDKYVELSERAAIANRNKADLFISIHVNSAKSTQARGTETFVMGTHKSEANFEVCKLENSVIVIEEDYEKKYEGFNPGSPESYIIFSLLQNVHQEQSIKYAAQVQGQFARGPISVNRGVKQGGLLVLWKTTMPAVLTELGFISNPKDCAVLVTKKGQEQFARGLFNAFVAYKKDFEKIRREDGNGRNVAAAEKAAPVQKSAPAAQNAPAQGPVAAPKAVDEFYAVQILSVGKVLGKNAYDLKGRKDTHYIKAGNLYKYYVGRYASRKEAAAALPGIRKSFPGAFVIHIKDNVIIQ